MFYFMKKCSAYLQKVTCMYHILLVHVHSMSLLVRVEITTKEVLYKLPTSYFHILYIQYLNSFSLIISNIYEYYENANT